MLKDLLYCSCFFIIGFGTLISGEYKHFSINFQGSDTQGSHIRVAGVLLILMGFFYFYKILRIYNKRKK